MEEKKSGSKAGIFILVSVILLAMMGVLGYYVYQLKQDNKYFKAQAETLQTRVDAMGNAIEKIQGTVDNTVSNVSTNEVVNKEVNNTVQPLIGIIILKLIATILKA